MRYDFNRGVNRKNTNAVKWDQVKEMYGDEDVIPMWIADMDFEVAEPIVNALKKRMEHPVFGYSFQDNCYYQAVIDWMKNRHSYEIKKEWIKFTPGIVPALNYIVRAFTHPGDEVIIQAPVYYPFYKAIRNNGAQIVKNPLKFENETYSMDLEDLKKKITNRTRMLILCNPHNPVGRVWTREELIALGEICMEHNILVISDEIHFDLIYKNSKHTMFASINERFAQNSITCTAPSKTFNIAGIQVSNIIIPNDRLRKEFSVILENNAVSRPNVFAIEALKAAYNEGGQWLDELMEYIEGNKNYLMDFFKERIPKLKVVKPEGTYLLWIDCSALNMTAEKMTDFFVKKVKIGFDDGIMFGEEGAQFQRINIACPRSLLKEALERIEKCVNEL